MEAVAAVGVAAAAVQFLDFGVKALVLCKQIRDSDKGTTEANQELEHHIDELKKIYNELQQNVPLPAANRQITRTRQECVSVQGELLKLLNSVKASSKSKNFATVKATFLSMKGRREIEKLQNKLADSQKRFLAAVSVETLDGVARLLEEQGNSNDTLRNVVLPELRQGRAESSQNHLKTHEDLSQLKASSSVAHDRTHSQLRDIRQSQQASQKATECSHTALSKNFVKLGTGIGEQLVTAEVAARRKEVMDSLWYPEIFDRQQTIKPPSNGTFEWIFDDPLPEEGPTQKESTRLQNRMRGKFAGWLRSDETLFWISGKAGSGKSSLMSLIQDDPRTEEALSTWAGGRRLYTFSFYFWRPGSALQKSIRGLLRSMLFQLAKARPAIVDLIISVKPATYNDWTTKSLLAALKKSLAAFQEDRIFLMADGLDEYEDGHAELLDVVFELQNQPYVKTCLASRPETAILDKLKTFPTLRLQDLNNRDISKFVWDRLQPHEEVLTKKLIFHLINRAEGVFLWAALAVKSMISGCLAGDDAATLRLRLDLTPTELAALFKQLLSGVEEVHQESLSLCLFHLNGARWCHRDSGFATSISLIAASLPICRGINSIDEFTRACVRTSDRLTAQWKGLVEIDETPWANWFLPRIVGLQVAPAWLGHRIQFVHRSAYDFFFSAEGHGAHSLTPWLTQDSDTERLAWMTLDGLHVLLQQAPAVSIKFGRELSGIDYCAKDAILVAKGSGLELTQDFFEWLDGLRTNFVASFESRSSFWAVVSQELSMYTESRWSALMEESQARAICGKIVMALSSHAEGSRGHKTVEKQRSLHRRLMDYLQQTHKWPTATSTVRRNLTVLDASRNRTVLLSWVSSVDKDEAAVLRAFKKFYSYLNPKSDFMREIKALMYDWGVYHGVFNDKTFPRRTLQLQISEITRRVATAPSGRPATINGPHLPSPRFRMLCLLPGAVNSETQTDYIPIVASFDLNSEPSQRLSRFLKISRLLNMVRASFPLTGSQAELNGCLEMLVKEIWANEGGVLDAWQQLYMLACVKKGFKGYWTIVESEASSVAGYEDVESDVSLTSDDSSDN